MWVGGGEPGVGEAWMETGQREGDGYGQLPSLFCGARQIQVLPSEDWEVIIVLVVD